jgi:transcriptional regulator with XRE-family HTH domain
MESNTIPDFLTAVGQRIEKVRELRGLTRDELATRAAMTYAGVYAVETKGHGTQIDTLYKIAVALDVSPGFLLDGGSITVTRPTEVAV